MPHATQHLHNPCSLDEYEQIPAKIWELLRRNAAFRDTVQRLRELDAQESEYRTKPGQYHGPAWQESWEVVERVSECHSFAGVALQWLVPEPLFHVESVTWPLGKRWKERRTFKPRVLAVGEGTTPDTTDKEHWHWWKNSSQANHAGRRMTRGPDVHWTTSKFKRLCDKVNPLQEWQQFRWPFTVNHPWNEAPPPFRRQFQFIWRGYDSRATNPITNRRSDSAAPHESDFFQGWRLEDFRASGLGNLSHDDLVKVLKFHDLADKYRVFAVPCALLTRQAAKASFAQLYNEVASTLPDERHFFGTPGQWDDFLAVENLQLSQGATRKHAIQSHIRQNYGIKQTEARQKYQTYETDVTVGVNPSSTEFEPERNWSATKSRADWKNRLKKYFNNSTPAHKWFDPWRIGLALLDQSYEAGTAAHFDVSYRPTTAMLRNPATDPKEFRRMVEQDVKWFFSLVSLCPKLRLLLISVPVVVCKDGSTERLAQFLKNNVPPKDFTVSQDGNSWACKRLDSKTTVYVHEVSWPGENCVTCRVVKNLHAHRHELLPKLGQQTASPPLP